MTDEQIETEARHIARTLAESIVDHGRSEIDENVEHAVGRIERLVAEAVRRARDADLDRALARAAALATTRRGP